MAKVNNRFNKKYQKPSDKFWRENLMKILHCLQYEELTWSKQHWKDYGISSSDQRKIEQEFARYEKSFQETFKV